MGFMEKLRSNVFGVVGTVFLFLILIIFVWGDASQGTQSVSSNANLAGEINGQEIGRGDFDARVNLIVDQQRQMNPEGVDEAQVREAIWSQIVDETIIAQAAERWGITVTDDELREKMYFDPPDNLKQQFTDSTGTFLQTLYFEYLSDPFAFLKKQGFTPEQTDEQVRFLRVLEQEIRTLMVRDAVMNTLGALAVPSPVVVRQNYNRQNTKISGSFVHLSPDLIPESEVNVTEDEAKKYYDDHKDLYHQKSSREVRYTMIRQAPSDKDSSRIANRYARVTQDLSRVSTVEAKDSVFGILAQDIGTTVYSGAAWTPMHEIPVELQSLLDSAQPKSIVGPVTVGTNRLMVNVMDVRNAGDTNVKASHIILTSQEENDSLKGLIDEIAAKARAGEDFAQLAQQYGQDGTAQQGGDLGYFSRKSNMDKQFMDAAFSGEVGEIVGPIKTQFGYHIIKVTDKSAREYRLRAIGFDLTISPQTRNALRRKAEEVKRRLEKGEVFDSIASNLQLQVLESGPITGRAAPISGSGELTNFAVTAEPGAVSDIIQTPDDAYIVGKLEKINQEGPQAFENVRDQIMTTLRQRKKVDLLKARAEKLAASIGPSDSLSKVTAIDSAARVQSFTDLTEEAPFPGGLYDFPLTAAAFSLKKGQISKAIRGENGYYIVQVTGRTEADDAKFKAEKSGFTKQWLEQQRQSLFQQWLQEERDKAEVIEYWR